MKKVYLFSWAANNLGDDLFLKIISERYKNKFLCVSTHKYKKFAENIKFINNNQIFIRVIRKAIYLITKKKIKFKKVYMPI